MSKVLKRVFIKLFTKILVNLKRFQSFLGDQVRVTGSVHKFPSLY